MSQKYEKLKTLLKELFQLDQPDLDFGLYRVMHAKSAEVSQFLDKDLLPQVQTAFSQYKTADKTVIEQDLAKAIEQAQSLGVEPESVQKVKDLRARLANEAVDLGTLESEVYDHLFSFFRRYYSEGDFLAKRVYKPGVYAIPYEGEEVTLHWANKDQYYIKTSEYLRDYAFRLRPEDDKNPMRVHFRLADVAEGQHGNVKAAEGKDRVFVLGAPGASGHDFIAVEEGKAGQELSIRFEYRPANMHDWPESVRDDKKKLPAQKDLLAIAAEALLAVSNTAFANWIVELKKPHQFASGEKAEYTRLEAHLRRYSARNTFDYFIHKDLGGFLHRELDFYIKNEVMYLDDIENESTPRVEQYLSKIKVIRKIARKIIAFLAQLENFQKKLWLKKKFVIEVYYIVSLRSLPSKLFHFVSNSEKQREEWVKLYGEDINDFYSKDGLLEESIISRRPNLVIDSRNFSSDFLECLLDEISDQHDFTDGVLVNSENYQGLSLLKNVYKDNVQCIYIDPPYNTGQDGFVYKDNFKSASWASMMHDRLNISKSLLKEDGLIFSSINEIERHNLEWQLRDCFGSENRIEEVIWVRDTVSNNSPTYSTNHEYVEVFSKNRTAVESNRDLFRETKPGFFEVMQLVESLRGQYPAVSEIEEKIRGIYREHKILHVEEAMSRGESKSDALKSDPWKGLYPYKNAEYRDSKGSFIEEAEAKRKGAEIWIWREVEPSMPAGKQSPTIKDPNSENYRFYEPLNPDTGEVHRPPKRGWAFPQNKKLNRPSFERYCEDKRISFKGANSIPQLKYFLHEVETVVSNSVVRQYSDGEPKLEELFGQKGLIDNPKPPALIEKFIRQTTGDRDLILDFFAGSGTTAQSVIQCNRNDGGSRKFLLIEMGSYFEDVLVPRIKKVIYGPEWVDGVPIRQPNEIELDRSPRMIKVLRMESYEDTLNNLELRRGSFQKTLLDSPEVMGAGGFHEQYVLHYMLDVETRVSQSLLNIQAFIDPTAYKLKVKLPGSDESREVNVDLLDTFNWLIGLSVQHIAAPQSFTATFERDSEKRLQLKGRLKLISGGPFWFRTVTGTTPDGRKVLVIWRKLTGVPEEDNLVLDEWLRKHAYSSRDLDFDLIYVNGGNNLPNMRHDNETWKVRLIEEDFHRLMFETEGV